MADKLPSVREHADKLLGELVENGTIKPDADAHVRAAGIPTFSKGTATLDENTGKPIAPASQAETPSFTEGAGVAMPEGTTSAAAVGAKETPAREAAPTTEPAPEPAPQAAGAEAAEQAAQAVADAFAEYDEFEFDDPDLNVKIPIRVPKQYGTTAKRGYGRRAAFDRAMSYLKNADPTLRPLIEDGRINQVLPLIQRALNDPAYGEYVWGGYERSQKGLPLIEQAKIEAAAAAPPEPVFNLQDEDPFFAERVRPILQQVETLQQKIDRQEQERAQQAQVQQQQQQVAAWRNQQLELAHRDLAQRYPAMYTGDLSHDNARLSAAIRYANEAGYVDAYGPRSAVIFAADQIYAMEQERLAATASPTAQAMQAAESKHMDLARQQAAAASRTVGGGAPTHAPAPAPIPPPTTTLPDGTMKPASQYLREVQAYHAQQRVSA